MKLFRRLGVLFFAHISSQAAYGVLDLSVRKGVSTMIPVCVSGLDEIRAVQDIVENDLKLSGFFKMLPPVGQSTGETSSSVNTEHLRNWKHIPGSVFVQAKLEKESGEYVCRLGFYNVLTERFLGERVVRYGGENTRLLAHRIANAIYKQLTGEPGYFHSVIAYTCELNSSDPRNTKRGIALVSVDGKECQFLTSPEKTHCLIPHCAQNRPVMTYLIDRGYAQYKQIGVMQFVEKSEFRLPYKKNFNSTRISADGSQILFSCASENGSSLFSYNLDSGKAYPLTYAQNASIDVSPSYSPDGKRIVFVSDRIGGLPKLFIAGLHSSASPACISKGQGRYFAPVWSPCGKWIAFVKKMGAAHYLCVSDCHGGQERAVAKALVIDRPSWGPNSRCLAYSAKNGDMMPYRLHIVHAFGNPAGGNTVRIVPTMMNGVMHGANHPSWYPLSLEGHRE